MMLTAKERKELRRLQRELNANAIPKCDMVDYYNGTRNGARLFKKVCLLKKMNINIDEYDASVIKELSYILHNKGALEKFFEKWGKHVKSCGDCLWVGWFFCGNEPFDIFHSHVFCAFEWGGREEITFWHEVDKEINHSPRLTIAMEANSVKNSYLSSRYNCTKILDDFPPF